MTIHVQEYRKEADNLRSMAAKESNTGVKDHLLELARQYDVLAAKREAFLELQEEICTKRDTS